MKKIFTSLFLFSIVTCFSQEKYNKISKSIDANHNKYEKIAHEIWSFAEMGYKE